MSIKTYEVLVLPKASQSYYETVQAINPAVAKQIVEARVPGDWSIGNCPKEVR